jgi:hypothetical protein
VRELGELRAAINGDDVASRRLLASLGEQLGVQGILVVRRTPAESATDGGTPAAEAPIVARLFLVETQELDAARYEPEGMSDARWSATVSSLNGRFPAPRSETPAAGAAATRPPPTLPSESKSSKPFYMSPWLWGAIGAAVFLGGFFYFASQDNSDDPIHLQMHVPR